MKILPEILKREGIKSEREFFEFLKRDNKDKTLQIINPDNRGDILGKSSGAESIVIQNAVIDLSEADFSNFSRLVLINCIFTGRVTLFQKKKAPIENVEIEIENCIFMKEVICNNIEKSKTLKIAVYNSNFAYLSFTNVTADEIILNHSKLFMLYMENITIDNFETENNRIEYLDIKDYGFTNINFNYEQINRNLIKNRMKKKFFGLEMKEFSKLEFDINLFEFIKFYGISDLKKKVHTQAMESLIKFIKEETDVTKDKKNFNEILFWETFFSQKNAFSRCFIWVTRAFFYPGRFLILGGLVFLVFSIMYTIPVMQFSIGGEIRPLNIGEAVYFAGVTFTTLGYGEISPVGISRVFAIFEAFMGIITMNTFIVALVKKYID